MSVKSVTAIENFYLIAEKYLKGNFSLRIIDVNVEKEDALKYQIIAIPTLIRVNPQPSQVIIGDLTNTQKVLHYLGIDNVGEQ